MERNRWPNRRYKLTIVAETGDFFREFAPYVASILANGDVCFQAETVEGNTGVWIAAIDGSLKVLAQSGGEIAALISHPDIVSSSDWCVYASLGAGETGLVVGDSKGMRVVSKGGIGPFGPTMNESGAVAFRATRNGVAGIWVWDGHEHLVAEVNDRYSEFFGLPVVTESGSVIFRANRPNGLEAVCKWTNGETETIADTSDEIASIAPFPTMDGDDVVLATALKSGEAQIIVVEPEGGRRLYDVGDRFESVRGALFANGEPAVFYGTPQGEGIGVFSSSEGEALVQMGKPLLGGVVADFALNPVSVEPGGRVAIRVKLEDGRGFILRADPISS